MRNTLKWSGQIQMTIFEKYCNECKQLVAWQFQQRVRNLCAAQQRNAAQSGISFAQQTKLVFIFSPRTTFLAKANERIKMGCNSFRGFTVFKQFSFQSSTSSCIGWESDWPSAPFVCCNESFSRTVLVGIQKNKNWCNFFSDAQGLKTKLMQTDNSLCGTLRDCAMCTYKQWVQ